MRSWLALGVRFCQSRAANFAVSTALLLPLLLGVAGGATDFYVFENHRSQLQSTADAAVLAAASEAGLKGWSEDHASQVVASMVQSNMSNRFSGAVFDYKIEVDEKTRTIDILLTQDHYGYFVLGYFTGSPQISVQARARAMGQATICIIARSPKESAALEVSGSSRINASGCAAYSNSVSPKGLTIKDSSRLATQLTCSAGGYSGKSGSFSPAPLTDCPVLADPLATRAAVINQIVDASACNFHKIKLKGVKQTLAPGTYCGGLEISGGSVVQLQPGLYVIREGKMRLDQGSTLKGDSVGLVFSGDGTTLEFKNDSTISLSAPETGPMAGILLYAQGGSKKPRDFRIESKNAQKLVGTVYLPKDNLIVGGDKDGDGVCDPETAADGSVVPGGLECISDVGATSSWTAIITNELKVTAGSRLVLNANYSESTVPVPDGIGPNSSKVQLLR